MTSARSGRVQCNSSPDELSSKSRHIPIALDVDKASLYHLAIAGSIHKHIQQHTWVINAALGEASDLL